MNSSSYKEDGRGNTRFYQYLRKNGGWNNFSWIPLYSQVELVNRFYFIQENKGVFPSSPQELLILKAFSQFQIRIIEQALITHYNPDLVTQILVSFTFGNWSSSQTKDLSKGVSIIIYDNSGNVVSKFNSQNDAALFLGIAATTLRRYTNLKNVPVFSPTLNQYIIPVDERLPISLEKTDL